MQRTDLIEMMVGMLKEALEDEGSHDPAAAGPASPLLGQQAVLTSMSLVTLIIDAESVLAEEHGLDLTLVSEEAFSRRNSPFRTVETIADYVLELAGDQAAGSGMPNEGRTPDG